jgi:hypothetical protein
MSTPEQSDTDLWADWDQYHRLIEQLIVQVHQSGWEFDQILCLARGGMRVGDIFSRVFDRPLATLATSSYREEAGTKQGSLAIAPFVTMANGTLTGRILIVDDMVDSGQTFDLIREPIPRSLNCGPPCFGTKRTRWLHLIILYKNWTTIPGFISPLRPTTRWMCRI